MKVLKFIFLSLILHLCISLGLKYSPFRQPLPASQMTEVEFIEQKKTATKGPSKQVVRSAPVPEELKAPEDQSLARFLSENRVRVKKETQATQHGMTQNNAPSAQQQKTNPITSPSAQRQQPQQISDEEALARATKETANVNPFALSSPSSPSTIGEKLPSDVQFGSLTALNTDRYLYYTFYARVEELVRYRWETRVRSALASLDPYQVEKRIRGREWVSQFEFWLDSKGNLHSVHLMKESGVKSFDMAAENAFKEARIFPNPPKDLIEDDGFIRLKYSFMVSF